MINKLLLGSGIFFGWCAVTSAGTFYLASMAVWDSYYVQPVRYEAISPKISLGFESSSDSLFKIGAEIWVDPIKGITETNHTHHIASLKPSYSYGASLLPGYRLDDMIYVYIRVGGLQTKFANLGEVRSAWQAGAGAEYSLGCTSPWSLRGEWDYSKYTVINGLGAIADSQYGLGAVYRFG